MAFKKKPKLESMNLLKNAIGEETLIALMREEAILRRDSNGKSPFQVIIYPSGEIIYDSRSSKVISYECFEEVKVQTRGDKGFDNFYRLGDDYVQEYHKLLMRESN